MPLTESMPASTVVVPVNAALLPVKRVEPEPICRTEPPPEIEPAKVESSERLKASVPLLATSPTIEPELPPLPSCRVLALPMIVAPV
jgi:hypothetical protein